MKRIPAFFTTACCTLSLMQGISAAAAEKEPASCPSNIVVMIADFGTINSVAKTENWIEKLPKVNVAAAPAVSEGAALADPNVRKEKIVYDLKNKTRIITKEEDIRAEENERVRKLCHALRENVLSKESLRNTIVAKELLQAAFFKNPKYSKFFTIIDRSSSDQAMIEKALSGEDNKITSGASCILTVTLGDPEENIVTIPLDNSGTKQIVKTFRQPYSGKIRDLNGNILFAFNGTAVVRKSTSNVIKREVAAPHRLEMEKVCSMIADEIVKYFTTTLSFKSISKSEDFDDGDVTIYVDGKEVMGDSVVVLAFPHKIKAVADGYKSVEKNVSCKDSTMTIKLNFKKETNNNKR